MSRDGKKTGGRNFEPGNPGGPGRKPIPEDLRQAREMLRDDFERIAHNLLRLTKGELKQVMNDESTPSVTLLVASVIAKGLATGDQHRITFLLDRLIGPVAKAMELSGPQGEPFRPFEHLSADELTDKISQLDVYIEHLKLISSPIIDQD